MDYVLAIICSKVWIETKWIGIFALCLVPQTLECRMPITNFICFVFYFFAFLGLWVWGWGWHYIYPLKIVFDQWSALPYCWLWSMLKISGGLWRSLQCTAHGIMFSLLTSISNITLTQYTCVWSSRFFLSGKSFPWISDGKFLLPVLSLYNI